MKAVNQFRELDIELSNEPELIFDTVSIALKDGNSTIIPGPHKWNRLYSTTDLTPFFGESFDIIDSKWWITGCFVCDDKTSIYFSHASVIEDDHV